MKEVFVRILALFLCLVMLFGVVACDTGTDGGEEGKNDGNSDDSGDDNKDSDGDEGTGDGSEGGADDSDGEDSKDDGGSSDGDSEGDEKIDYTSDELLSKLEEIKDFVITKQAANCEYLGANFLHATNKDGEYSPFPATEWTSGFYPGLNYLCYEMSGEEIFKETNDELLSKLPPNNKLGHDIGMVFSPSAYADYMLFGTESSKEEVVAAAEALIARFNDDGDYIKAWDGGKDNDYRMIIDTLFNLPILYRAYEITGNKKFYNIALAHTRTAERYLVRDDYTTAHTFIFNPDGTPSHEKTHQGYADDSCWARGHAWGMTGFAMAYRFTGKEEFLRTAKALAAKYTELTDDTLIPKWDLIFKDDPDEPYDTSAAAIIANGFMEIYDATGEEKYKDMAYSILIELYENYSSKDDASYQGLIRESVSNKPANVYVSVSLIYTDYFFAELLSRFLGTSKGYW